MFLFGNDGGGILLQKVGKQIIPDIKEQQILPPDKKVDRKLGDKPIAFNLGPEKLRALNKQSFVDGNRKVVISDDYNIEATVPNQETGEPETRRFDTRKEGWEREFRSFVGEDFYNSFVKWVNNAFVDWQARGTSRQSANALSGEARSTPPCLEYPEIPPSRYSLTGIPNTPYLLGFLATAIWIARGICVVMPWSESAEWKERQQGLDTSQATASGCESGKAHQPFFTETIPDFFFSRKSASRAYAHASP